MTLRLKLESGQPVFGGFVFSTDPGISEIYGEAGFDFCIIDLEHAANDVPIAVQHIRACEAKNITAIVRVGKSTESDIPRLLDAGAAGIMLPHFGLDPANAHVVPATLRYPPHGSRPTCTGIRAASYGLANFAQYAETSNKTAFAIGLIEDREAVDEISAILGDKIVDCVMPGPGDLASSMGVHGQFGHPNVAAAVDKVLAGARAAGVSSGMYVSTPAEIPKWYEKGARLFVLSIDYKILGASLTAARNECTRLVGPA